MRIEQSEQTHNITVDTPLQGRHTIPAQLISLIADNNINLYALEHAIWFHEVTRNVDNYKWVSAEELLHTPHNPDTLTTVYSFDPNPDGETWHEFPFYGAIKETSRDNIYLKTSKADKGLINKEPDWTRNFYVTPLPLHSEVLITTRKKANPYAGNL